MHCPICTNTIKPFFKSSVLNKYEIEYFLCDNCMFMTVEEPYWLEESYNRKSEILDVGRVNRAINNTDITSRVVNNLRIGSGPYLDFGGGDGLFSRIMRDSGYDFYLFDPISENRFAQYFDIDELEEGQKYDLVTAFEVFEHLRNPFKEILKILNCTEFILISTELMPNNWDDIKNWWYLVPESGQHISFYSDKTFEYISKCLNLNYFRNGNNYHLLTKQNLSIDPFKIPFIQKAINKLSALFEVKRISLIEADFQYYKNKINV